jgi:hypothetical protein
MGRPSVATARAFDTKMLRAGEDPGSAAATVERMTGAISGGATRGATTQRIGKAHAGVASGPVIYPCAARTVRRGRGPIAAIQRAGAAHRQRKLALARRRYPRLGPLGGSTALILSAQDFQVEHRQEMTDLRGLLEIGGGNLAPDLKRAFNEAAKSPRASTREFEGSFRLPK